MLIDLRKNPDAPIRRSAVCVIGAGAAGITLARSLAARGHTVTLLESGGLDFEQPTQDLYKGQNVGLPYYALDQARLRFFGGTVAIWGGRCARLDPIDFQPRSWVPHSGWPVSYSQLEPYYRRAHQTFELGAFDYREGCWDELRRRPIPFDPQQLETSFWRFDEVSERFTAAFARDLFGQWGVQVVLHANVVRLQARPGVDGIAHVRVATLDGAVREIEAKHYVLACGAIENARLLLVSNDVEKAGIGNAQDQVGRYFMEHPYGRLGRVRTRDPVALWALFQKRFQRGGPPLAPVLRMSDAVQRQNGTLNCSVTFKLQRDPGKGVAMGNRLYHEIKHALAPDTRGRFLNRSYRRLRAWFHRSLRETIERARARMGVTQLYVMIRGEQAPNPESPIMLSPSERDAFGLPRVQLDWQLGQLDKHTARIMAQTLDGELRRLGIGEVEPGEWLDQPGTAWPVDPTVGNHPIAGYHHMGGTRMSADPEQGVVDAHCRVHGYDNLFVAGSSVFPTGGWANPTLTIVALSLRLSDHLHERLRTPAAAAERMAGPRPRKTQEELA
jgi:choline dehydrogenase-like flavoprotein